MGNENLCEPLKTITIYISERIDIFYLYSS